MEDCGVKYMEPEPESLKWNTVLSAADGSENSDADNEINCLEMKSVPMKEL